MSPRTKHALSEFKPTTELAKGLPSLQIDVSPPMRSQYWNQLRHQPPLSENKRKVRLKKKRRRRKENDYIKIEKANIFKRVFGVLNS